MLTIERVLILKSVEIFSAVSEEHLEEVASLLIEEQHTKGTVLIHKGEIGESMYIICEGKVKVYDGDTVFDRLGKGKIVGELSVLSPLPRTASVMVEEDAFIFKIDREAFLELLAEEYELMRGVIEVLVSRIVRQNEKISGRVD